jgi:hypothetical protein
VDGFVHLPAHPREVEVGPLTLAVDAAHGLSDHLTLTGEAVLPERSGSLSWTAEVGSTLAASHGSLLLATASLPAVLRPWIDMPLSPEPSPGSLRLDWRGLGDTRIALDLDITARVPAGPLQMRGSGEVDLGERQARLQLAGTDLAWRSADAARAVSGAALGLEATATYRGGGALRADLEVSVTTGELLWDRFYADLGAHPLALRARVDSDAKQVALSRATLSIRGLGTVKGDGRYDIESQRAGWHATFDLPGLADAYRLAVSEPLQADYPVLARVDLRGRAGGRVEQEHLPSGARRLSGSIDLAGVTVSVSEPSVAMAALDVHLPFDLIDAGEGPQALESGLVRVRGLRVGDSAIGDFVLPLHAAPNRIAIAAPVRIAMLGGALEIAHLRLAELASDAPQVHIGLAAQSLDLVELSRALGWPPLTGRVVGAMPDLTIDRHQIRSAGEIHIEAFGGTARLQNLRIDEPLSPVPTLHLDVDFADVSLAQLTGAFEVGRISGVASGGIRGLEIVNGQPSRFEAWMQTVPRSGVPQRISVTAIRQLSIVGGSGGDPFSTGVLSLFD